jgi:hypothetical protein
LPISLAELKQKTASVQVYKEVKKEPIPADALTVTYFVLPDHNTEDEIRIKELIEAEDSRGAAGEFYASFCKVVKSWDLLGDDGEPIPITPEAMLAERVQTELMQDILRAIALHKRPGEAGGRPTRQR